MPTVPFTATAVEKQMLPFWIRTDRVLLIVVSMKVPVWNRNIPPFAPEP